MVDCCIYIVLKLHNPSVAHDKCRLIDHTELDYQCGFFLKSPKKESINSTCTIAFEFFGTPLASHLCKFSIDCHCWNRPIVHGFALITSMHLTKTQLLKGTRAVHRLALTCSDPPSLQLIALQLQQT